VKSLAHTSFAEQAERICALYNDAEDALHLGMLGQQYTINHDGIFLHGQHAPENQADVILDYLFSSGTTLDLLPWRTIGDFSGQPTQDFRERVELPILNYVPEIITRANILLPMMNANTVPSLIGSDMAFTVQALPKVYLRLELSQESQDFPNEAWVLFSNNANRFLLAPHLRALAELCKDRLLSLLRIY
jgi:hypothetical protein